MSTCAQSDFFIFDCAFRLIIRYFIRKSLVIARDFRFVENSVDNVQNYLYNPFILDLCKPFYFDFFTIFSLPFFT